MAENKKKNQRKFGKPSISVVNMLKAYSAEMGCNLHPKKTGICVSCQHYNECSHFKWERDYLNKQMKMNNTSTRRAQKNEKVEQKRQLLVETEVEDEDIGIEFESETEPA